MTTIRTTTSGNALAFLFLTEMWERYGFYVVQGLLVLYMSQYFGFSDNDSYIIQGVFTALVYISPLAGGFLADRLLGFKTAIIWGGLFLIVGYALLALMGTHLFYPALATIIVGNGLFKPNISSLLGMQYDHNDPRRDSAFTIFYIGINIGAFLAGISSGYIKEYFGWQWSFGLASIGLLIGVGTFLYGHHHIQNTPLLTTQVKEGFLTKVKFLVCCILAIVALSFLLKIRWLAQWLLPGVGVVLLVFLAALTLRQEAAYRKRLLLLNILIISSVVFWMLMLQIFFSANLFVDRLVDKNWLGLHLSTTVFYASESIFIILLGPFFAWSWQALGQNEKNPSPISKFSLGIFFAGLGFVVLSLGTHYPNSEGLINPLWVFAAYFFITVGELLLSPIGLSAVTLLAPPHLIGMMMGIWFVGTGFGGIFAGWLAEMASVPDTVIDVSEKLAIYQSAFLHYANIAFFVAVLLFFVHVGTKKWLRE